MMTPSTLFHFTTADGWEAISRDAKIALGKHSMHLDGDRPLIWLTDSDNPTDTGLHAPDMAYRIEVGPAPGIHYWPVWSTLVDNAGAIDKAGGTHRTWYVGLEEIPLGLCSEAINLDSKQTVRDARRMPGVEAWGPLPDADDVNDVGALITSYIAPHDLGQYRAYRLGGMVAAMNGLLPPGADERRARIGWRSLLEEAGSVPDCPERWAAS
ncbi:hypothetical protein [Streptomyces sp. NPDC058401]|uniref:hypothetical protein n=1 Tax=Streptomyces sp. NPDC058401 TaxID=3346480 RepID=UPI003659504F